MVSFLQSQHENFEGFGPQKRSSHTQDLQSDYQLTMKFDDLSCMVTHLTPLFSANALCKGHVLSNTLYRSMPAPHAPLPPSTTSSSSFSSPCSSPSSLFLAPSFSFCRSFCLDGYLGPRSQQLTTIPQGSHLPEVQSDLTAKLPFPVLS